MRMNSLVRLPLQASIPQPVGLTRGPSPHAPHRYKKKSSTETGGRLLKGKDPSNLLRGRLGRGFLCASGRFSGGSWSFRCSRSRQISRRRCSSRSWSCHRSDSFSFLLTRREKRGTSQDADVFLHNLEKHNALIDQSRQAQFLDRRECSLKHK